MNIIRLPIDALRQFLEENREGLTDDEFVAQYAKALSNTLLQQPELYRTFGAHWWPLKRILLGLGLLPERYGNSFESEPNALFSEETDALTVCAAFLAQQDNLAVRMMGDTHFVYEADNGESYELELQDEDFEKNIFSAKLAPQVL